MRMLDEDNNRPIDGLLLMLTPEEAAELRDTLDCLLTPPYKNHSHISDINYQREITVAIYTPDNIGSFAESVQRLIKDNSD